MLRGKLNCPSALPLQPTARMKEPLIPLSSTRRLRLTRSGLRLIFDTINATCDDSPVARIGDPYIEVGIDVDAVGAVEQPTSKTNPVFFGADETQIRF